MTTLTVTVPVGVRLPIGDALERSAESLAKHAARQRVQLGGEPVWRIEVRCGVPHLTVEQDVVNVLHPECGTDTGYAYHRRRYGTPTCEPCRAAHARAEARRVARRNGLEVEAA